MNEPQTNTDITHAVGELLAERQELLVSFCRAAGLDTGDGKAVNANQHAVLKRLCQILMDYYALWQFEIHDGLVRNESQYAKALHKLQKASEQLDESRTFAVAFNDKYDPGKHAFSMSKLGHDLSLLGEQIAQQIELEDRVIQAIGSG